MPREPQFEDEDDNEEIEQEGFDESGQGDDEAGGQGAEEDATLDSGEEQETRQRQNLRRPNRGDERIQHLANENRSLRERLDQLDANMRRVATPQQREESEDEFNARIANLMPDERMEARFARSERRNQAAIAQANFNAMDAADRAAFNAKAAANPLFARYATEVEQELAKARAQGVYASREAILAHIIGTKALSGDSDAARQERQRAKRRVERQTTRPTNNRSDAGTRNREQRGRGEEDEREARRRRLENARF